MLTIVLVAIILVCAVLVVVVVEVGVRGDGLAVGRRGRCGYGSGQVLPSREQGGVATRACVLVTTAHHHHHNSAYEHRPPTEQRKGQRGQLKSETRLTELPSI